MGSYLTLCKNSDGISRSSHTYACTFTNVYLYLHVSTHPNGILQVSNTFSISKMSSNCSYINHSIW